MRRIGIFIFILLIIVGGYYLYTRYTTPATPANQNTTSGFKSFFSGSDQQPTSPTGSLPDNSNTSETTPGTKNTSRFTQISSRAVAGFTTFSETYKVPIIPTDPKQKPTTKDVTDQVIRYISRATGYVYEKRNSDQPIQISNIYIPNIYEGTFIDNNNTAILRFLRDDETTIATYSVPVPPKNTDGSRTQKSGSFFADNIKNFFVSPDQTEIGTISDEGDQSVVMTSDTKGGNKKELLQNPFHEWLAQWPIKNTIYLQTKAAATADGFLYKVDRTERKLRRILGNIPGLTTNVSPSGTYILYSESSAGSFTTKIFNTKTNSTTVLNLKLLPEKCVWQKNEDLFCAGDTTIGSAAYPDAWYAGINHFSDKIFHFYTKTNTFDVIYDNSGPSFDVTNLAFTEGTNYLYFIDKNTGILWQLNTL